MSRDRIAIITGAFVGFVIVGMLLARWILGGATEPIPPSLQNITQTDPVRIDGKPPAQFAAAMARARLPMRMDAYSTLTDVLATEDTLTYRYVFRRGAEQSVPNFSWAALQDNIIRQGCSHDEFRFILKNINVAHYEYRYEGARDLVHAFDLRGSDCG